MMYRAVLSIVVFILSTFTSEAHFKVVKVENGYTLTHEGKPFTVRGAGLSGIDVRTVKERGGNSIRTWGIETARETLDAAEEHELFVLMGLPVAAERFGFDYDDPASIAEQRKNVRDAVEKYKDHKALLGWILGNELDMAATHDRVYDEVNKLAAIVREIDPDHPTTMTLSAIDQETVELVREKAPNLDFLSLQAYGALALMPKAIKYLKEGPFMITEWGPLGHWEVGKTRWGAPVEQTSTEKGRHYLKSYRDLIQPFLGPGLGSYAFLWGQKQERTHTWFSLFTETGESTAAVDALEIAWAKRIPSNQAPVLNSMTLARRSAHDSIRLAAGRTYKAKVDALDPDGDSLSYEWQIKPESTETVIGGDFEQAIADVSELFEDAAVKAQVSFKAPDSPGNYRIYVMIYDGQGHAAHANIPFLVFGKRR